MKEIFYQSETISLPIDTEPRAYRHEIILDQSYQTCVGICVIETADGGVPTFRIGVEDRNSTIISPVNKHFLMSDKSAGLKLENRVMPINVRAEGSKIKIVTDVPEKTTKEISYDVILVLQREAKK